MCFDYVGAEYDGCWQLSIDGEEVTFYEGGKSVGTARLLTGNPRNL